MKDTAPISQGIIAVSALFAIVATGVAYVAYDFWFFTSAVIGGAVGIVTAIVLALGWRAPAARPGVVPAPATGIAKPVEKKMDDSAPAAAAPAAASAASTPAPVAVAEPEPVAVPDPAPTSSVEAMPDAAPAAPVGGAAAATPQFMSAPRETGPDDLKQIKGIGPKLENTLHNMGIYHYDQIAAWGPAEQAWMDDNLEGFKGRATRDQWVAQAQILAAGGETAFSNKVKDGDVY